MTAKETDRRTGRTSDGDRVLHDDNDVLDLWCINPWLTSHMIGAAHSQPLDAAEQERVHEMLARVERSATPTAEMQQDELKKEG